MQFEDIQVRYLPILQDGHPGAVSTVELELKTILSEAALSPRDKGLTLSFLGEVVASEWRYREAQELYRRALPLVTPPDDRLRVLVPAADLAIDLADEVAGRELERELLAVLEGAPHPLPNAPWGWAILARIVAIWGDADKAVSLAERGVAVAQEVGAGRIEADLSLGEVLLETGRIEESLQPLERAAQKARGDCLIRLLITMAKAHASLGRNNDVTVTLRYATEQVDSSHLRTAERLLDAILVVGEQDAEEGIRLVRRVREHLRLLRRRGGER